MHTFKIATYALNLAALLVVVSAGATGQDTAATGAVNLALVDDSGAPVVGAFVSIHKAAVLIQHQGAPSTMAQPGPSARASSTSDITGKLSASALESGEYGICIITPSALGIVSPCRWNGIWRITIAAGQTAAPQAFVLHKGGVLSVQITDTQHLLPNPDSLVMPSFTIGLQNAAGNYFGMKADEQVSAVGRDYTTIVPFNTPLRLQVFSARFRFADQSGAELVNGGNIPVNLPSTAPASVINITVVGTGAQ